VSRKAEIESLDSCAFVFISPSGDGLKGALRISETADYISAFLTMQKTLKGIGFEVDAACKDIRRACFLSSDPDIYINLDAREMPVTTIAPAKKVLQPSRAPDIVPIARIYAALQFLDPSCQYDEWVKIGMAIHHATNGEAVGLKLWDDWSSKGKTYEAACEEKWFSFNAGALTIGTLFKLARDAGFNCEDAPEEWIAIDRKFNLARFNDTYRMINIDGKPMVVWKKGHTPMYALPLNVNQPVVFYWFKYCPQMYRFLPIHFLS